MDAGAIERLGEAIAESHAQQPSIATPTAEREWSEPEATTVAERDRHEPAEPAAETSAARVRPGGSCARTRNAKTDAHEKDRGLEELR